MRSSPSRVLSWSLAALTAVLAAAPAHAQGAATGWRFAAPEGARAMFAVLSGARFEGVGPLHFYKRAGDAPIVPDSLRRALTRDASFEVLHFFPLYLPLGDARLAAAALRGAASGRVPSAGHPAAFATAALASVLPRDDQRATLTALASTVERAASSLAPVPDSRVAELQRRWDTQFAPRLAPYLNAQRLAGGIILLSESLGPEGRIFGGRPDDATDNVVAVTLLPAAPTSDDATLFAVVRELCFPLVTRLASRQRATAAGRDVEAARASLAAVRCGEQLTARALPELAAEYRRQWMSLAGRTASTDPTAFQEAFPIDSSFDQAIAVELSRIYPARPASRRAAQSFHTPSPS